MLVQQQTITNQTALLIKKAGYPQFQKDVQRYVYEPEGPVVPGEMRALFDYAVKPPHGQVLRWLHNDKGLFVEITVDLGEQREGVITYSYCVVDVIPQAKRFGEGIGQRLAGHGYKTPEDAIEDGVCAAAKIIISTIK